MDRRIGKTRNAIFTALNELLREKRFAKITVQEIIDRADVGRATFYAHFPTKDDVLIGYVEAFFESFNGRINEHIGQDGVNRTLPVAALFTHVKDNKKTISGMFASESGAVLIGKFKEYWFDKLKPIVEAHYPVEKPPIVPTDMLTSHVINTFFGLTTFWIQDGLKYTPEQMEQYFYELIYPALQNK